MLSRYFRFWISVLLLGMVWSCKPEEPAPTPTPTPNPPPDTFDINDITDTYPNLVDFQFYRQWGPYNVHDPSILDDGEYFYCYSTDASFGNTSERFGLQIRRSKDLIEWQFVGWAWNGLPPQGANYIRGQGTEPFQSLWAPYILKVGSEYRLYYSLSSEVHKLSAIGLLTATSPEGPWTERGLAVTSRTSLPMTNAIDPSVLTAPDGRQWMYYGSAYDGIYVVELDPATGLAKTQNDKGHRIAQRGFTGGRINGNIEGPEIIYHPEQQKYYLFIAYDWLETKYNVRVGRADSPEGPFLDFNGVDLNGEEDNGPMILAPYQFEGHPGWQGVSHCAVWHRDGQYYLAHQGRPVENAFYMVLHVRKVFWTEDGWPVVSPERYAGVAQTAIETSELAGNWEQIAFGYRVVPGYAEEQTSPDLQTAVTLTLEAGGTINGETGSAWTYEAPWLTLTTSAGTTKVYVARGRDWENQRETLVFSGLEADGTARWGKQKP
ncbi:arabinan endo-1,5-alpha-L-arabinosidase [Catalinimonas alkaloidigena]|uniref:Arabinan endo-1,5-alpha-L-arabinosidase n=1 Tax=Catalinimonas alkaloidigena TaxID=1075417 RepID=A0A1G9S7D6_9BACT|nr:arabinan endo-1,5-alpha-L-arabinosidase [Catalinimonas alkaloidigena]SDM31376.1 arabinan endo-1,5-alpha-L-arabinosidase [Catalinimonas alkaloidigena]